jgi:hypothetical protein
VVHPPLCMVLLTCCRHDPAVLLSSSSGEQSGVCLIRHLLRAACAACESSNESTHGPRSGAEWLPLLLGEVAGSGHSLQLVFCALGSSKDSDGSGAGDGSQRGTLSVRTAEQAFLLHVMADAVELRYGSATVEDHTMVRRPCRPLSCMHTHAPWTGPCFTRCPPASRPGAMLG